MTVVEGLGKDARGKGRLTTLDALQCGGVTRVVDADRAGSRA